LDEEEKLKQAKKAKVQKADMETAQRLAQEIQDKKKRQVAVYEKLEQELTKFELEEEEDEFKMGNILD
jgi:hypothetical protein